MSYRPQSEDTSRAVEEVQFRIYRGMTPAEKVELVRALCRRANDLALAGLLRRHPEEDETQLRRRLAAIRLGDALAGQIATRSRA